MCHLFIQDIIIVTGCSQLQLSHIWGGYLCGFIHEIPQIPPIPNPCFKPQCFYACGMWRCVGTCVWGAHVCVRAEERDWCQLFFVLHLIYWGRVSHLNPWLTHSTNLASQLAPEDLLSPSPRLWYYKLAITPAQHQHECRGFELWSLYLYGKPLTH